MTQNLSDQNGKRESVLAVGMAGVAAALIGVHSTRVRQPSGVRRSRIETPIDTQQVLLQKAILKRARKAAKRLRENVQEEV